jgi:alpha-beta hydrolase superfamily lysophospholipase
MPATGCSARSSGVTRNAIAAALVAILALCGAAFWMAGSSLVKPTNGPARPLPGGLAGEPVRFPSESGAEVSGVLIHGKPDAGIVMLLHGIRSNRAEMYGRARFLNAGGYTVLLFDFQAHGETPGEHITAGYLESADARAARDYLLQRWPEARVAAIANSMGGAAVLLATPPLPLNALIIEEVYPTIESAVRNRMRARFGFIGALAAPALLLQLELRMGIAASALRPIDRIAVMGAPVLIIGGAEDRYTPPAETNRLFDAAVEPKQLWIVDGLGHEDAHAKAGAGYEQRVLGFLATYLRP